MDLEAGGLLEETSTRSTSANCIVERYRSLCGPS